MSIKAKNIIALVLVAPMLVAIQYWQTKWVGSNTFLFGVISISVWLVAAIVWILVKVKD